MPVRNKQRAAKLKRRLLHKALRLMGLPTLTSQPNLFPFGHFYSPIADIHDIKSRQDEIWSCPKEMPGIAWNQTAQLDLLHQALRPYVADIHFPEKQPNNPKTYFYQNDQFPILDAEVLFCLLRHFKPRHMIEVGSGFSSLVTAHVNQAFLGNELHFACIEPYPRQFLIDGVEGISELMVSKVEKIPLSYFEQLQKGDFLFIDSSHVSKVGSDVNYLFFEVLPRLNEGVLIHIHDIFLPDEYPKKWVIEEGRHWNEQYLVRAFLEFNTTFEIIWAAHFMAKYHGAQVQKVFTRFPHLGGGGSLWLRKTG